MEPEIARWIAEGSVGVGALALAAYTIRALTNHLSHMTEKLGELAGTMEKLSYIVDVSLRRIRNDE